MILIHNRVSYDKRGSYTSINKSDVLRAIKTLNHEGLKGWMMCALNSEGFPWREGTNEISRDALNELCRKGYMRRTDDQGNWEFDVAGGYNVRPNLNASLVRQQTRPSEPAGNTKELFRFMDGDIITYKDIAQESIDLNGRDLKEILLSRMERAEEDFLMLDENDARIINQHWRGCTPAVMHRIVEARLTDKTHDDAPSEDACGTFDELADADDELPF